MTGTQIMPDQGLLGPISPTPKYKAAFPTAWIVSTCPSSPIPQQMPSPTHKYRSAPWGPSPESKEQRDTSVTSTTNAINNANSTRSSPPPPSTPRLTPRLASEQVSVADKTAGKRRDRLSLKSVFNRNTGITSPRQQSPRTPQSKLFFRAGKSSPRSPPRDASDSRSHQGPAAWTEHTLPDTRVSDKDPQPPQTAAGVPEKQPVSLAAKALSASYSPTSVVSHDLGDKPARAPYMSCSYSPSMALS